MTKLQNLTQQGLNFLGKSIDDFEENLDVYEQDLKKILEYITQDNISQALTYCISILIYNISVSSHNEDKLDLLWESMDTLYENKDRECKLDIVAEIYALMIKEVAMERFKINLFDTHSKTMMGMLYDEKVESAARMVKMIMRNLGQKGKLDNSEFDFLMNLELELNNGLLDPLEQAG